MTTTTKLRCISCRAEPRAWVVYFGKELCLDCAAQRYELTGDVRLQTAWLIVKGKELDYETKGGHPPCPKSDGDQEGNARPADYALTGWPQQ